MIIENIKELKEFLTTLTFHTFQYQKYYMNIMFGYILHQYISESNIHEMFLHSNVWIVCVTHKLFHLFYLFNSDHSSMFPIP